VGERELDADPVIGKEKVLLLLSSGRRQVVSRQRSSSACNSTAAPETAIISSCIVSPKEVREIVSSNLDPLDFSKYLGSSTLFLESLCPFETNIYLHAGNEGDISPDRCSSLDALVTK
jgi:hypothetical protein